MKFNINKKLKIEFRTDVEGLDKFAPVVRSSQFIPKWFKEMKDYVPEELRELNDLSNFKKNHNTSKKYLDGTVKRCPAIIDLTTEGFIIPLWSDYLIQSDGIKAEWSARSFPVGLDFHPNEQVYNWDLDKNDFHSPMKFVNPWRIYTPPGYSCLFIAPYYQFEKRFTVLPGIVETDKHHAVQFPSIIHIKGDILLERNTPLVQIIPFKKDKFDYSVGQQTEEGRYIEKSEMNNISSKFKNGYKDWVAKEDKWK
jgi:hypothetical protein